VFQKILAATEVPTYCDAKVQTAALLADKSNGKLCILHVLESTSSMYRNFVRHFRTGEEIVTSVTYEEEVRKEIEKHCAPFLSNYEIKVTDGFPWEAIVKYERDQNVDLIVVGPHSQSRKPADVQRVIGKIGSTAEGVILHTRCPTMLVNGPVSGEKLAFRKILTTIDYSESCKQALSFAVRLTSASNSKLYVFYMAPLAAGDLPTPSDSSIEGEIEKLKTFCRSITGDLETEYSVGAGERPHLEILKFARDEDVDLITMGSHTKREKNGRWYPGSVVEGVGARSNCPVVVVTDPRAVAKMQT
jgi:nucleotide-binding universal stress UspA family protein